MNSQLIALVVLSCWVLAGVVLAFLHTTLARHHEDWWYETVGVGVAIGLYGLRATRNR